jgi:hypothetical protein
MKFSIFFIASTQHNDSGGGCGDAVLRRMGHSFTMWDNVAHLPQDVRDVWRF